MSTTTAFKNAFIKAKERNWDVIYIAIDIHDTIIKANYKPKEIPTEFYPFAIECLRKLTSRKDIKLILYTCSHPHEIDQYLQMFEANDIHFDFVNENSDVVTDLNGYGNYDKKPYFSALFDDKAGFNPERDWLDIKILLDVIKPLTTI